MNFALGVLLVIILLLPGVTFQKALYNSAQEKFSNLRTPFNELLIIGVLISLAAHCFFICIIRLAHYEPNSKLLYDIIINREIIVSDYRLNEVFLQFVTYNIAINFFVFLLAKGVRRIISQNRLDLRYNFFNLYNDWYKIFSGRILDTPGIPGQPEDIDVIYVDVLTEGKIIYCGLLRDYSYDIHSDKLEKLLISNAYKRDFRLKEVQTDSLEAYEPRPIPGNFFVIPGNDIKNINIRFIKIETIENRHSAQSV